MRSVFFSLFVVMAFYGQSQTKLIFHKSHSGTTENFRMLLEEGSCELDFSNFGMAPERTVKHAYLDSLIFISDTVTVMVTSEYCSRDRQVNTKIPKKQTKWRAGKDTLYHHDLFSRKNSIGFIKEYVKQHYFFENPVDSIRFINASGEEEMEYQVIPVASKNNDRNDPFNQQPLFWLSLVFIFSMLTSGILYLLSRWRRPFAGAFQK